MILGSIENAGYPKSLSHINFGHFPNSNLSDAKEFTFNVFIEYHGGSNDV